jgi:CHASE2 domain-containing sensor protein
MSADRQDLARLHAALGYKPLNRAWAKVEIILGLFTAGVGLLLGEWVLPRSPAAVEWGLAAAALTLFVLGGYLSLVGHRSHLYQSKNELTAFLVEEMHRLKAKG